MVTELQVIRIKERWFKISDRILGLEMKLGRKQPPSKLRQISESLRNARAKEREIRKEMNRIVTAYRKQLGLE